MPRHLPLSGFDYPRSGLLPASHRDIATSTVSTAEAIELELRTRRNDDPFAPDDGPSTAQHPWGFLFRVLLLPLRGTPLGVSPLLPFPGPTRRRNQRDFRGLSVVDRSDRRSGWAKNKAARGTTKLGRLVNHRPNVEPYPRGCSPLQGFLLHRLGTQLHPRKRMGQEHSPSCPFDREYSLQFHSRAGLQGIGVR